MSTHPIVGAFYHPPAKVLLEFMSIGTSLILMAEPENTHDENAISVWIRGKDVLPNPSIEANLRFEEALSSYGTTPSEVESAELFHLGYIPREQAAVLKARGFPNDENIPGEFTVSERGAARVRFDESKAY